MASKKQQLLDLYEAILASLDIHPDDTGALSLCFLDDEGEVEHSMPMTTNERRVVLPTQKRLKNGDWSDVVAFHPLSENILRGESEIIKLLKRMVLFRLSAVTEVLMTELMEIAADTDYHNKLQPTQSDFLTHVREADQTTSKALTKMFRSCGDRMINIYLKRGGELDDREYRRVANVSFPIWEELHTQGKTVFDVELPRKKDKATIAGLFQYIFPEVDNPEHYSAGSDSDTAPYFDALMQAYVKLAERLRSVVHKFRKHLSRPNQMKIDTQWASMMGNIDNLREIVPPLEGNQGATARGEHIDEAKAEMERTRPSYLDRVASVANQHTNEQPESDNPPWEGTTSQPLSNPSNPPAPTPAAASEDGFRTERGFDYGSMMRARNQAPAPAGGGTMPSQSHLHFSPGPPGGAAPAGGGGVPMGPGWQPQSNVGFGQPNPVGWGNPHGGGTGYSGSL